MRDLDIGGIPTSLGEIINFKHHLDIVKPQYDRISLSFHKVLWKDCLHTEAADWKQKEALWDKYLSDIGKLFFSDAPYVLEASSPRFYGSIEQLTARLNIAPQIPRLAYLLAKGQSLNLGSEYIVITTKLREFQRSYFDAIAPQFWNAMRSISKKYKVVILGERKVEMRKEYNPNYVSGIYDDIIKNLPSDVIVDLTVPALGETVSDLSKIQQDCLIMKEAKFVVNFGVGGNFCLATSTANMAIVYRTDNIQFTDQIFLHKEYPNAIVTKDPNRFLQALKSYA
jgi:hypothetical protein